jgi:hypothetical protein
VYVLNETEKERREKRQRELKHRDRASNIRAGERAWETGNSFTKALLP